VSIVRSVITFLFCFSSLSAGLADTSFLPVRINGQVALVCMKELKVGDELFTIDTEVESQELKTVKITNIKTFTTKDLTFIGIGHGIIYVGGDDRFYNPKKKEWLDVKDLRTDDYLLDLNFEPVRIGKIERISTERKHTYFQISTEEPHCFFTYNDEGRSFLVHNYAQAIFLGESLVPALATLGTAVIYGLSKVFKFGKRKRRHRDQMTEQAISYHEIGHSEQEPQETAMPERRYHGEDPNGNYVYFARQDGSVDIIPESEVLKEKEKQAAVHGPVFEEPLKPTVFEGPSAEQRDIRDGVSDYPSTEKDLSQNILSTPAEQKEIRDGIYDHAFVEIDKAPSTPVGRKKQKWNVPAGTNIPQIINGREYSGHAIDRMQQRGFTPGIVEHIILNGEASIDERGCKNYIDKENKIKVVESFEGKIITVKYVNL
jgi:hypothetical protein